MKCKVPVILEKVVLRGIEGVIGDAYLTKIAEGHLSVDVLSDFQEAAYMAEQIFMQWRGLGLK